MKFIDLIEERNSVRARLEVYTEMSIFLQEFIATDSRPAKRAIEYQGSQKEYVPEYIIEEIIQTLDTEYIQPLTTQLNEIEQKDI